jgi:RNA polymerase-associated protein RTF1
LSKARSGPLSSISYINERNRKRNVERAEEAILEEIRASGGQKAEDPFTRRSTKPRMIHRPNQDGLPGGELIGSIPSASVNSGNPASTSSAPQRRDESSARDNERTIQVPKPKTGDLFAAHDFDIKIDLEVPLPCEYRPFLCRKL